MSKRTISTITDKVMDGMAEWQSRPLDADMRIGVDTLLHLECASDGGGNKDLSNPHSR